ncbi:MAG: 6,7-dimethyl-8-ribityllumazine synthase [Neomegalonema sp.]|nr:6,7-dimethyl-8-ribityllumazine synthase [Neomegalonema sp.]
MASSQTHTQLPLPRLSPKPRVLLVVSPYYRGIADQLIHGAEAVLAEANAIVEHVDVPGALEIAPAIRLISESGKFDGFVALGCVIRGATSHYELVCGESARGITELGIRRGLCIGNGILTVENMEQAAERADPTRLNKGRDAAVAALHLIALRRRYGGGSSFRPDDEHILLA